MYTTGMCPYCVMAKRLLQKKGVAIEEVRVDTSGEQRAEMMRITGRRTVPQIFVGETHVGGYDELAAMEHAGTLDPLLNS
jgi:glutaredoxin 3